MAKNNSIPVRLEAETIDRIDTAAAAMGIPRSTLIRMLVERFVDSYERNGNRIMLPLQVVGADECDDCVRAVAEWPVSNGSKKNKKPAKA